MKPRELVQTLTYAETQRDILSLIARDQPQPEVLEAICLMVEVLEPEVFCTILLLDNTDMRLYTAAAPTLKHSINEAINGIGVGPKAGRCGTSVYRRELVVAEDIATDPLWDEYRELVLSDALRACWAQPLLALDGTALGTFALYRKQSGAPTSAQIDHLETAAKLATIAITRTRDRLTLLASEQHFRSLFTFNNDAVYSSDLNGHFKQVNGATLELTGLTEEQLLNQHFAKLIVSEDLEHTEQHFKAACRGFPQRYEMRIKHSRGKLLHLDVCNIPIIVDEQIVGVFSIADDITEREVTTHALQHALAAADRRADQLRAVSEVAIACGRLLNRKNLIDYLISQAGSVIEANQVVLILADDSAAHPEASAWLYALISRGKSQALQISDAEVLQRLSQTKQSVFLDEKALHNGPRWHALTHAFNSFGHPAKRSLILTPLIDSNNITIGMLLLSDKQQGDFDQDDLAFASQFAQMAVASLENIRLISEVVSGENRLKSQLAFTSAITDSMSEGLVAVDSAGCITFANPAAEILLDTQEQQVLGHPLSEILPIDCARWQLQNSNAIKGEFSLISTGVRTLLYDARPMLDKTDHGGWVVTLDDITAKRQGDRAMRERNQFFDLSLEMFCIVGLSGELVQVNPAFAETLHYREDQLIGKPYKTLVHADDQLLIKGAIEQLQSGHLIRELNFRVWDQKKHLHWLQFSAALSEDHVIYCSARDITERKNSEQQLRLFKRSLASSYNGVVIVDALAADRPIIYVNAGFERITGYNSDELIGRNCRFLQGPERDQKGIAVIRKGLVEHSDIHVVLRNYRKDGSEFMMEWKIAPIHNEKDEITHYLAIQREVS